VELGNDLDINAYFTIITHDFATFVFRNFYHDFVNGSGKVKIGNNIVFGRNVTILKGVSIGDNCIIGAGSVVSKSIPSNSVAVGVPAKVVCSLEEYYERRKSKQVTEAIDFAKELASVRGGVDNLSICDFPEEWVLFLTEEEYYQNESVQRLVDFRLKNYCDIQEFLNRPKPFNGFEDFKKSINFM
jgi:acyl-[acyl carrier protein]--UDP-N-acetylglucosamine O-acyltransferase